MVRTKTNKARLRRFLRDKEIFMNALVAANIALLVYEHFHEPPFAQLLLIDAFDILTALIFIAEFIFEWYWARDRRLYIRHHWFYLLAAVPVPTASFEILRGVRALRLLKLLKIFAHMRYERNTRLFEASRQSNV
jgi:voltage-gated potassium channel